MTLDILICSLNKGIVRIDDLLRPEQDGVRYVVSYQYTDERYLELVPDVLKQRKDVVLSVYKGQGLSNNRNHALELAKADLVIFADDDSRLSDEAPAIIERSFRKIRTWTLRFSERVLIPERCSSNIRKSSANLRKSPPITMFLRLKWSFAAKRCRINSCLTKDLASGRSF